MTTTLNAAFNSFLKDEVNLAKEQSDKARKSRDFLKEKIAYFDDFFSLYDEKNIDFGSFARKTKIQPLDDIDMIFTLMARGCTWEQGLLDDTVYISTPEDSADYKNYRHDNSYHLNSRKIINEFIRNLKTIGHYDKADFHRNQNAATLKLTSYDWNFDIVPGFFTTENSFGKTYYIIPDGEGNWMKTDPRLDRKRVTEVNQTCGGHVLNTIRAIKYWQRRATMPTISSYLLENIVVNYFATKKEASSFVDINIINILGYIQSAIFSAVNDPKGIQGDLNNLNYDEQLKISSKAKTDYKTSLKAYAFEKDDNQKQAIQEWQKIFGDKFPKYTGA